MKVAVIGLGFVGLPLAVVLAGSGHQVVGYDRDCDRLEDIVDGRAALTEPGLSQRLEVALATKRLEIATQPETIGVVEAALLAVPTPLLPDRKPDYRALLDAVKVARQVVRPGGLVIVESTIAPRTCVQVLKPLLLEYRLAHCPERIMPRHALFNLFNLPRVLGAEDPRRDAPDLLALYNFSSGRLTVTDWLTAELTKTAENAYRDVQIAFANELAALCEAYGADVWQVRDLINQLGDREVLEPGAGVGGHCLPKDGWLLMSGHSAPLIQIARTVNENAQIRLGLKLLRALQDSGRELNQARVIILGETYRPGVEDVRHSPGQALLDLLRPGVSADIHDPLTRPGDLYALAQDADALVLVTAHQEYRALDWERLRSVMRTPVLVDGRGLWRLHPPAGFSYHLLGRGYA